jgi:hypothetical protein
MTGIFTPAYSVSKRTGSDGSATAVSLQGVRRLLGSGAACPYDLGTVMVDALADGRDEVELDPQVRAERPAHRAS